jgi:hypothetical protein
MKLEPIIQQIKTLPIKELRRETRDYCEIVLANEQIDACREILESALGSPVKQAGAEATEEMVALTEDFGEIVDHQVLFSKADKEHTLIAMLWPWRDDVHTTLVMGYGK